MIAPVVGLMVKLGEFAEKVPPDVKENNVGGLGVVSLLQYGLPV